MFAAMDLENRTPYNLAIEVITSHYRLANELLKELAEKYQIDEEDTRFWKLRSISKMNLPKGNINDNWTYWFHGSGCEFSNNVTGQFLYVRTTFHYGIIDFYYLYKYMETTPELSHAYYEFTSFENFAETLLQMERDKLLIDVGDFPEGTPYKDLVLVYLL